MDGLYIMASYHMTIRAFDRTGPVILMATDALVMEGTCTVDHFQAFVLVRIVALVTGFGVFGLFRR